MIVLFFSPSILYVKILNTRSWVRRQEWSGMVFACSCCILYLQKQRLQSSWCPWFSPLLHLHPRTLALIDPLCHSSSPTQRCYDFGEFLVLCKGMWQRAQPKSSRHMTAFWYGCVLAMWPSQTLISHPCSLLPSLDIVLLTYYQETSLRWKCLLPLSWNRTLRNRAERRTPPKILRSTEGSPTFCDTVLIMISLLWNMSILLLASVSPNPYSPHY